MIGHWTDRLLHYFALLFFAWQVTLALPAKAMTSINEVEDQEQGPPLHLYDLLVRAGPLPERLLKEHLKLRLPSTTIWGASVKELSEFQSVVKKTELSAKVRISKKSELLVVELLLSDGRFFRRELESVGKSQLDTRAVASSMANLVAAIESGKPIARSTIVSTDFDIFEGESNESESSGESISQSGADISESGRRNDVFQVERRKASKSKPGNTHSDQRMIRDVRRKKSQASRQNRAKKTTSNPRPMMIELVGAPVLSLGMKDSMTVLRGVGLELGTSLRTRSQYWISIGVRNRFPLPFVNTNTILLRTLVSTSVGYVFRGGESVEFPLEFGFTVEPWWIWKNNERVEPLVNATGQLQRPLVGALIRIRPGFRIPMRLKRKSQLYIELPLEFHMSGEARRGFGAPVIKREVQDAALYRLGGLELNVAFQLRWGLPISG